MAVARPLCRLPELNVETDSFRPLETTLYPLSDYNRCSTNCLQLRIIRRKCAFYFCYRRGNSYLRDPMDICKANCLQVRK